MVGQSIELRRAAGTDAADIWSVRTQAISVGCRSHYPADLIDAWASGSMPADFPSLIEGELFVVAASPSCMVGFAGLKRSGEVDAVFVRPDFVGQGLGRRLLLHLELVAKGLGLTTLKLKASLNSVAFYQAGGYIQGESSWHVTRGGLQIACVHMEKVLSRGASV